MTRLLPQDRGQHQPADQRHVLDSEKEAHHRLGALMIPELVCDRNRQQGEHRERASAQPGLAIEDNRRRAEQLRHKYESVEEHRRLEAESGHFRCAAGKIDKLR